MLVIALAENGFGMGMGMMGMMGMMGKGSRASLFRVLVGNFCRPKMHGFLWEDFFWEFHHGLLGGKNRRCNLHALNQLRWVKHRIEFGHETCVFSRYFPWKSIERRCIFHGMDPQVDGSIVLK